VRGSIDHEHTHDRPHARLQIQPPRGYRAVYGALRADMGTLFSNAYVFCSRFLLVRQRADIMLLRNHSADAELSTDDDISFDGMSSAH
jgi:hypothetical protein